MTDFDKKLKRNINAIKRSVKNLKGMGLNIELEETETMMGENITHVYVVDYTGERVILQKHLFSV